MPFDVELIRKDFPMLSQKMNEKPFTYLDSAATTQKPQCVIDAMTKFYSGEYATVHRGIYEFAAIATEKYSETRLKVQKFIGASSDDEIVFTRGATEAINLVAKSYGQTFVHEGDEVLITEMEHHSNIVPWQLLCEEKQAKLIVVPINELGEIDMVVFEHLLSDRTKIVSVAHVSNALGTLNPIEEIIRLSHEKGAVVLIDGAQSVPHLEIDVQKMDADFFVFSAHKLYGPTGVGVLYGKKVLLDKMPVFIAGGDTVQDVTFEKTVFQGSPLKFEAGTPAIAEVIGLGAAISYYSSLDRNSIMEHEKHLLQIATKLLSQVPGLTIVGQAKNKEAIISFKIDSIHPLDLGTVLALKGIAIRTGPLCAQPAVRRFGVESLSRISFGMYNTIDEIRAFYQALIQAIDLLGSMQPISQETHEKSKQVLT